MEQLVKKIKIQTTIELLTGLHIGGSNESVEIGGIDNSVIKLANKGGQPYIPGSSLKGKMRCLLEQSHGVLLGRSDEINRLFGITEDKNAKITDNIPSRIIVRDAFLTEESANKLRSNEELDLPYTELKSENTISRDTSAANPRQFERIPAGAVFQLEMIINVWKDSDSHDNEEASWTLLRQAMNLLKNDYLGGNGSRGYGQIKFGDLKFTECTAKDDWKGVSVEKDWKL